MKPVFGTKEWAETSLNIIDGCSHDCKYCYAKEMAIRFNRRTPDNWKEEVLREKAFNKKIGKRQGTIMYPTTHDIVPEMLDYHVEFIGKILNAGNKVLIVSKPHLHCIRVLTHTFFSFRDQILFRFTIGSADEAKLSSWEENAPSFHQRLEALDCAFKNGFATSVSAEPMLDTDFDGVDKLIQITRPHITDALWLGKMNNAENRVRTNGHKNLITVFSLEDLKEFQKDENIKEIYLKYKDDPKIKWKESIKKVVGLKIPEKAGLDI